MYDFLTPYLGEVKVCWDCRRELAFRTMQKPLGLVPLDLGRIGYECKKCGGSFTSTDAMTCTCPGRKRECRETAKAVEAYMAFNEITNSNYKPRELTK